MLKIKNGNIFLTRGQNASINFKIWNEDGTPVILPRSSNTVSLKAYAVHKVVENKHIYLFYNPIKDGTFKFTEKAYVIYTVSHPNNQILTDSTDDDGYITFDGFVSKIESTAPIDSISFGFTPYIIDANSNEATIVVFSVYAGSSNSVVLQKILNMNSYMTINGVTDYSAGGWNKFTTAKITKVDSQDEIFSVLSEAMNSGELIVVQHEDMYYQLMNTKTGLDIGAYDFSLSVPLDSSDTDTLQPRNYTYDVTVYKGVVAGELFEKDELLFEKGYWKRQLVSPHTFTIGDSQNA